MLRISLYVYISTPNFLYFSAIHFEVDKAELINAVPAVMTSSIVGRHGTVMCRSQVRDLMTAILLIWTSVHWTSVDASTEMFTSLTDVQRALDDELSATELLRHYISIERQRIEHLQR